MIVSLNELESMVRKAFRGAGYQWGEAEEAGKAAIWLARRNLPVAGTIVALLDSGDGRTSSRRPAVSGGTWRGAGGALCPVLAGIALADGAQHLAAGDAIRFEGLLSPLLMMPFVAIAADESGLNLALDWPGGSVVAQPNGARVDLTPSGGGDGTSALLQVWQSSSPLAGALPAGGQTPEIESVLWAQLNRFAMETYVPASERSRVAGAGAGLADTD